MPEGTNSGTCGRANRALDAANFFLADVRDGLGPYLAVYLLREQKWDEARIGIVMSVATFAGIVAQTPAGALVDATRAKRLVMASAAILVTFASLMLPLFPSFWPVAVSQGIAHAAGVVFPPAIAAVSLGIVGHRKFTARIGRNESFNHAGNAAASAVAGVAAIQFGPSVIFYLLAAMSLASLLSVLSIPEQAIDHDLARGLHDLENSAAGKPERDRPSGLSVLLTCRPLLVFAGCAICFTSKRGDAAAGRAKTRAPGQEPRHQSDVCLYRCRTDCHGSGCDAGRRKSGSMGAQAVFSRCAAYTPCPRRSLYAIRQSRLACRRPATGRHRRRYLRRDFPVIVADLMRNTGRFNVAQGAVITAQSIGAALSTTLAGLVVVRAGYGAAFVTLGAIAAFGGLICLVALPETRETGRYEGDDAGNPNLPITKIAAE